MFSSGPNYTKLKTNLRLAISRLKLLQKKKTELTEKSRREIGDYLLAGKVERAKIRVEYIIREDYMVEALEIVEMYCDLLLARFGLISNMKELDEGLSEAVSSLIWVSPRIQSDIQELKVISDLLTSKYGPSFAEACRVESIESISPKLKHKLSIQSPPKLLVEKYIIEIAKSYNIPYEPDPQVMEMEKGNDALLIDFTNTNNLGGGGIPQPPGFVGYPMPPPLPNLPMDPYPYRPPEDKIDNTMGPSMGPSAPPSMYSYNIPPGSDEKETNRDYTGGNLPAYQHLYPDANVKDEGLDSPPITDEQNEDVKNETDLKPPTDDIDQEGEQVNPESKNVTDENDEDKTKDDPINFNLEDNMYKPKPTPRQKIGGSNFDLPDLPSVPNVDVRPNDDNDIDFDDLTRRFNELKKKS